MSIPIDDDGFFGRECPRCSQHFRIAHEDYDSLPDDLRIWCVYCGHEDEHSEFITSQQHDRVMRAARDYAQQFVGKMLNDTFGSRSRRSHSSGVKLSYRSTPFFPAPLPGISEERLVRMRVCESCSVRYAVFGEHRFCPVCGRLAPLVTALDALNADLVRLDTLTELPDDLRATLRETGALQRTYVDTLENIVGAVEVMAEQIFCSAVPNAEEILKSKGRVFQRLGDFANLYAVHLAIDLPGTTGPGWAVLIETWAARNVFTHCDGIVDAKYLAAVPTTTLRPGQRLQVAERTARLSIAHAVDLCYAIDTGARPPT